MPAGSAGLAGGTAEEMSMLKRTITGVVSAAILIVVLIVRGWVFDIAITLVALIGCFEMQTAFEKAGHSPARWTVYGMAVLMLPFYKLLGIVGIYIVGCAATLIIMLQIAMRKKPQWIDAAASLNVLISVPIPLSMMLPLIRIEPEAQGALLVFSVFVIALLGDTFAYFVGVIFGRHRMAPALSPKKTWEGSAAGLLGSVVGAVLLCLGGNTLTPMGPVWEYVLLGLVGGVAGQLGDLTASLIKRFCDIKDFGTIFPGHGGIMDRFDSVNFVVYVVFGYCMASGML